VDKAFVVPLANATGYIDTLLDICRANKVQAIFPGSEPELKVVGRNAARITAEGIFLPINPQEVLDICFDKVKTVEFLAENGFAFPKSGKINNSSDLENIDFLPAVLKPSVGGSGSANIMIAQTKEELMMFGTYLLNIYDEFIAQEYIGKAGDEYTVGVLCSMEGALINSIAINRFISSGLGAKAKVKNRTNNNEFGDFLLISSGISQGRIGRFSHITEACEKIALKLGARSAINLQCRYWKNQVYVFEINPRFSGTTSLRALVGYNEPDIIIRQNFFGATIVPHFDYEEGIILRGLSEVKLPAPDFS